VIDRFQFRRVVVPIDRGTDASPVIAYLGPLLPYDGIVDTLHVLSRRANAASHSDAQRDLEALHHALPEHLRNAATASLETGDPGPAIVEHATATGADAIAMSTRAHGVLHRLTFGSVAEYVLRHTPVPVLIVREGLGGNNPVRELARILVPFDGSVAAKPALSAGAALASRLDVPLAIVTVVDATGAASPALNYAAAFSEELHEDLTQVAVEDAYRALVRLAESLEAGKAEVQPLVATGSPGEAIVAESQPGDLIVMTSHGRGGLERLLVGSTAEHVLRNGNAPVCLIRISENGPGPTRAE
jgi:nucleotide-binding universal stress UspA family protein